MINEKRLHVVLNYLIAIVWIVNGLICKLLNFVPRHQLIVSRILGEKYAFLFTKAIGISEILMAVWILSTIKSRLCTALQILIVLLMNLIEFFLAPDLLLFGKMNLLVALVFIIIVYVNEFVLNKKSTSIN